MGNHHSQTGLGKVSKTSTGARLSINGTSSKGISRSSSSNDIPEKPHTYLMPVEKLAKVIFFLDLSYRKQTCFAILKSILFVFFSTRNERSIVLRFCYSTVKLAVDVRQKWRHF